MRRHAVASLAFVAACGSGGGFPDAYVTPTPPAPGTFAIEWALVTADNQPATCAQASATTVSVGITDDGSGAHDTSTFNCTLDSAVSGALDPSTYDLTFQLVNDAGTIATATSQLGVVIVSKQTTQLATVTFVLPPP